MNAGRAAFLRIPPFPGARFQPLARAGRSQVDGDRLIARIGEARCGGRFWGEAPTLQTGRSIVLAPDDTAQLTGMLHREDRDHVIVIAGPKVTPPSGVPTVGADCDLWHLAAQAHRIHAGAGQEIALVAGILGIEVQVHGAGPYSGAADDLRGAVAEVVGRWRYVCPFTGEGLSAEEAVAQLGAWRRLIDSNRPIDAVLGVAGWKRATVDALLWAGAGPVPHARRLPRSAGTGTTVLAWKSRSPERELARAAATGVRLGEIEDGFIRSVGLGANCVPPLSAVVDWRGIYFDPAQESELEWLLEHAEIDGALAERAAVLRRRIVSGAISKYGGGDGIVDLPSTTRRRVLVTGQVEDDRSIISGGQSLTNLAVLRAARQLEPDAWIVYKPHPDVVAGHRKGHVADKDIRQYADAIEKTASIAALIDAVDAVHVITSLAGFEALLRGKQVTTHGTPVFAGWGLTRDLAPLPSRRTRQRTLDELVAATLLLYPRYVDPVTGLPCSAEVLIDRLENNRIEVKSPLITIRTWQGRVQRAWRRLAGY